MIVTWRSEFNPRWNGKGDLHHLLINNPNGAFRVASQREKDLLEGYALVMGVQVTVLIRKQKAPDGVYGVVKATFQK